MTATPKVLALVGCGDDRYRTYLLTQISGSYEIWLINDADPTWQSPYIAGASVITDFSQTNVEHAITQLQSRMDVAGIVCWDERYISVAADCAAVFGLPGAGSIGIRGCRDKALTREQLTRAGVLQPAAAYCTNADEAASFAGSTGYPVVVKPRGMGGSIGVALARSEQELRTRFSSADAASLEGAVEFQRGAMIEECVTGPEISIDATVIAGVCTPLFVAHKTVGLAPYFEELAHVVSADDPLLSDADLIEPLRKAHAAIGFENGITHTEVKLTAAGPIIIEINGRLGGDLIPYLASLAFGLKPGLIAGQIAAGDPVDLVAPGGTTHAAIHFQYPERDMVVERVSLPDAIQADGISGTPFVLGRSGDQIGLPPTYHLGRSGYAIATGENRDACIRLSEDLAAQITVTARDHVLPLAGE